MDATQAVNDSLFESDEEEKEEKQPNKARQPLAKLCILKNDHVPERGERQACSHQRRIKICKSSYRCGQNRERNFWAEN